MSPQAVPVALACVLLAVSLAGCLGDPGDGEAPSAEAPTAAPGSSPHTLGLDDCAYRAVQAPVDWDAVAEALPEGVQPAPYLSQDQAEDRQAELFLELSTCEASSVGEDPRGTVSTFTARLEVLVSDELSHPDVREDGYYVLVETITTDERRAQMLGLWGLPASEREPALAVAEAGPARTATVEASSANLTASFRVAIPGLGGPDTFEVPSEHVRYLVLDPPIFREGEPEVTGIVEKRTEATTAVMGEGDLSLQGSAVPGSLESPAGPAVGFDTSLPNYGWSLELAGGGSAS